MLERKPQDVTILDIGIGRGGQIRALLRNPLARERVRTLRVIGIEPDSSSETGTGALEIARARILEAAAEAGIRASFVGISKRAEDLTNDDVHRARPEGFFLANAAFALHHIDFEGSGGNDRGELLALVRSVGASAIVLVEPDSNHFIDALQVRFLYAYRHYRTVALSLDAMLPPANAQLVWNEFFAPEILNIIANEAGDRTERHEEAQQWSTHLRKAGWENSGLDALVPRSGTPHGFSVDTDGPAFSLCFRDVALLSVLRGTCPKIRPAETLEDPRE
jgi:hypothetical protein